jgi:hypothetical protein
MIVRMVSGEPTDGARMERATRLAGIALGRYGLRDARLRLLSHGFKEVFLVDPAPGAIRIEDVRDAPGGRRGGAFGSQVSHGAGAALPGDDRGAAPLALGLGRETDLAVPEPVPLPDGSLVGQVSFADLPPLRSLLRRVSARHRELYPPNHPPRHFALLRWVPGEHKEDPTADDLSRVGRLAAGLHDHAEGYRPPDASALPPLGLELALRGVGPAVGGGPGVLLDGGDGRLRGGVATRPREPRGLGVRERGLRAHTPRPHPSRTSCLVGPARPRGRAAGVTDFDQCGLGHYSLRPRGRAAHPQGPVAARRVFPRAVG